MTNQMENLPVDQTEEEAAIRERLIQIEEEAAKTPPTPQDVRDNFRRSYLESTNEQDDKEKGNQMPKKPVPTNPRPPAHPHGPGNPDKNPKPPR
jgi:hypothetical protein